MALGLPADESLLGRSSCEAAMIALLDRAPDLDAVFVASDLMVAQGAPATLERAGRRAPEGVAAGGFDDSPAALPRCRS
ncbi:hypothetical protein [Actinacidiphila glaucinigra]|uniref:hypothetical protein n=1 Tax=Actinacidiphila glaucinigra TaxID=235986 RepID=UPI003D949171